MRKIKEIHRVILLALLNASAAFAASPASDDTLTVTATGNARRTFEIPAMVSVVNNDTPLTRTRATAGELLSGVAGVGRTGVGRTNGETFTLRGYDKSGVLVLVDGIRQDSDMAKSSATFLDPALVKRVDVVRGASSSLYGSGGLGGVIDFQTIDAPDLLEADKDSTIRLFSAARSGDHSLGAGATFAGRTSSVDGILSVIQRQRGSIYQSDRQHAPDKEHPGSVFAKGRWQLDPDQSLGANLRFFSNNTREPGNPTLSKSSADSGEYQRRTRQKDLQLNYHLAPRDNPWVDVQTRFYGSETTMLTRPNTGGTEGRQNTTLGTSVTNRQHFLLPLAAHQLTYGLEYYQQHQKPSGATTLYPRGHINFASALFQDELTLSDLPASLIIGTRYDNYQSHNPQHGKLTASRWSPKAALSVTPLPWLMFYGSISSAFRAPTMGEMYRDGVHFYRKGRPNYWVPNQNLKPETNTTREAGGGVSLPGLLTGDDELQIKASYFSTRAKDYIATRVDMKQMKTWSYNVPQARIWGWDVQASYLSQYAQWALTYNRTEGMDRQSREWLGSVNPDTVVSDLSVPLGWNNLIAGWRATVIGPARHVKSDAEKQAGYVLHAFSLAWHPGDNSRGLTTSLVLDNAFNKQAWSVQGLPQPGRSVGVFLSYQW